MTTLVEVLGVGNAVQAYVRNLHSANAPLTPITDATITFTIFDADGVALADCEDVSMPHNANGNYFASCEPALTAGDRYKIVISCSNYLARWTRWYTAGVRQFD